jgi:hypothetical protein
MYEEDSDDLRTIQALPLLHSFLAAIFIPVIIAVVFGILGSKTNALLMQLELILVVIAFCLTGILSRSKLRGLLSIFAAPISWIILFLIDTLTSSWIKNPYGLFTGLAGPLTAIVESGIMGDIAGTEDLINIITQVAIIIDLIFVEILAFFLGFLLAALATGLWKKNGELSIFSIVMKPFVAIFTILIIVLVPFSYHGIANFADGGVSMGAGFSEFLGFFGGEFGGGAGAQLDGTGLDLNDPLVVENLTKAAENAEYWFRRSSVAFGQVQGNFLVRAIINAMFPEGTSYEGINMREITKVLDISDVFADVSGGLPYLLAGYQNLANGFNRTFSVFGGSSIGGGSGSTIEAKIIEYDPDFSIGLSYLDAAWDNFSDAEDYVNDALETAQEIVGEVITDETGQFGQISDIIDEAQSGYGVIIEVARGGIPFLNASYKTILAVDELGQTNFPNANNWMAGAATDLASANSTLQAIDTSGLNPDSQLPFYGTTEILKDMTSLLTYFSIAAANGTSCYLAIDAGLQALDTLDFAGGGVFSKGFGDISSNISLASTLFDSADDNMNAASSLSSSLSDKSYGAIIDGSLKPMLNDFSNMISQFSSNITEIGYQLKALEHTLFAIESFTDGVALFNQTWNWARTQTQATEDNDTFLTLFDGNATTDQTVHLLDLAIANASAGWDDIDQCDVISDDVEANWKNILHWPSPYAVGETPASPYPPEPPGYVPSIAGLSKGVQEAISALRTLASWQKQADDNVWVQLFFDNMDTLGLGAIFGG